MNYRNHFNAQLLCQKFQKVCRQLEKLLQAGKPTSSARIQSLSKRRIRYAKQLFSFGSPLLKTGSTLMLATLLSGHTQAQNCNTFVNADSANPVRRAGLPTNLIQPTFVDIDGDGDLDCYEANANQQNGGGQYLKITFLRNTGSQKVPYFKVDTASGFGKLPNISVPYNSDENRTTFVDIDGDGDYDCFLSSYNGNRDQILFYKNVGTPQKPVFVNTPSENPLANIHGYYGLQLNFADLDNDGDYDLTLTNLYDTELFINTGTKTNAVFQQSLDSYATTFSRVSLYDYNKDGLTDILVSSGYGAGFYKNTGTPTKPKFRKDPSQGPVFPNGFQLFTLVDLNNDGFPEAFSVSGNYATTSPVATIKKTAIGSFAGNADSVLHAYPDDPDYTYRWRKDGKIIPGQTSPVLAISEAGKYMVEITSQCGTGISLPYVISETEATQNRIASSFAKPMEVVTQPLLKAFPNPFTQQFTLYLGSAYSANTVVAICDIQGRIISTIKSDSAVMQLGSSLQKGVYIIRVIQDDKIVLTQKIIKQ